MKRVQAILAPALVPGGGGDFIHPVQKTTQGINRVECELPPILTAPGPEGMFSGQVQSQIFCHVIHTQSWRGFRKKMQKQVKEKHISLS